MFASKLLDILDALPTDEENEERVVLDTPEEKSSMKEDEKGMLSHFDGHKKGDSFTFPTLDFLDSIVDVSSKETLACETKDVDELWKVSESDVSDDIARSNDTEVRASSVENDLNEVLLNKSECDMKDKDAKWNTPEFECSIIPGLIDEEKDDSVVPDAQFTSGYKFFENDAKLYSETDDSGGYVSIPGDEDEHSNTTESDDTELLSSADGCKSSVEYENNEKQKTELAIPNDSKPGSPDEVYNNDDDSDDSYLEDLIMIFGSKGTAKWKHSPNAIPSPNESGVESYQQSTQPDQIPFEEAASGSQNADIVPATDLFNHSNLATEATVSDLNSTTPASTINLYQGVENVAEPSKDVANQGKSLGDFLVYSQGYLADGEASFSALRHGSGPAINSRRVSSFGRHSVGSDGSTTSNGSFAFPLLHPGWYSSPVRMVPVETTTHVPKQRRWKQGLLCCNF
ncbi:hypothetical protein H5410_001182 [Solanum commersonii]|uniref:Uncharacterized protein n=1 Tax=Solanum commersonii TaxID=4109 RepID=A0A9J6AYI4_SOLCO|nr:hypothetical protein H5410_001182 [Solanum commersonii]